MSRTVVRPRRVAAEVADAMATGAEMRAEGGRFMRPAIGPRTAKPGFSDAYRPSMYAYACVIHS